MTMVRFVRMRNITFYSLHDILNRGDVTASAYVRLEVQTWPCQIPDRTTGRCNDCLNLWEKHLPRTSTQRLLVTWILVTNSGGFGGVKATSQCINEKLDSLTSRNRQKQVDARLCCGGHADWGCVRTPFRGILLIFLASFPLKRVMFTAVGTKQLLQCQHCKTCEKNSAHELLLIRGKCVAAKIKI